MAEDAGSTAEVAQILETTEATADQSEIAVAPVVLPPEPTVQAEEAPQLEIETSPAEIVVQEETGPTAELEPVKEGQTDTGNTEQKLTFDPVPHVEEAPEDFVREATEGEVREATEDKGDEDEHPALEMAFSQEALMVKLARERKQRLKNAITNRFKVELPSPLVLPKVSDDEEDEDQEEEEREYAVTEDPPVIDTAIWGTIEEHPEEEAEGERERFSKKSEGERFSKKSDGERSSKKSQAEGEGERGSSKKLSSLKTVGIFAPLRKGAFDDGEEIFYMDPEYDTDDTISIQSLRSIRSRRSTQLLASDSVQLKANFLRDFEIPNLSDISEEREPEHKGLTYISATGSLRLVDEGHFVDPLTGDAIPSSGSSSQSSLASLFGGEENEALSPGLKDTSSDLSDLPDLPGFPSEVHHPKQPDVTFEELATTFREIETRVKFGDDEEFPVKTDELETMVKDFVEDLLGRLVAQYENRRSDNVLRSKCDKHKLFAELVDIKNQYLFEKYTNGMLTTRLVDYFKRVRNDRVFAELDPELETQYSVRYMQALNLVDSLKSHLVAVKHRNALQVQKVFLDLHSAQSLASFTEARLEGTVRKYLVRPDSEFLHRFVDYSLRLMAAKRNEISDMRLVLITKKHTLGLLKAKITELETLSSTVSIQDFITIQNETTALEKKIEERSIELTKMRSQYLMDVHLTHHNREQAHALADTLNLKKIALNRTLEKQRSLRASLYQQKLARTKIREKHKELTYQGGILAMPSLMYEYDNTVQQVKDSQVRVAKLRESIKALTLRVSLAEGGRSI